MNKRKNKLENTLLANSDAPTCETHLVNLENVRACQSKILPTAKAQQMAEFFGILAEPNRLRLLCALA